MLHVYNCILLKMSTWGSKHVEENSILWTNSNQCIKVGNLYIVKQEPRPDFAFPYFNKPPKSMHCGPGDVFTGLNSASSQGNVTISELGGRKPSLARTAVYLRPNMMLAAVMYTTLAPDPPRFKAMVRIHRHIGTVRIGRTAPCRRSKPRTGFLAVISAQPQHPLPSARQVPAATKCQTAEHHYVYRTLAITLHHLRSQIINMRSPPVAYPGIFFLGGGGSTNSVEDRDDGEMGAVAP